MLLTQPCRPLAGRAIPNCGRTELRGQAQEGCGYGFTSDRGATPRLKCRERRGSRAKKCGCGYAYTARAAAPGDGRACRMRGVLVVRQRIVTHRRTIRRILRVLVSREGAAN